MTLQILFSLLFSTAHAALPDWCNDLLATWKTSRAPQIARLADGQVRHVSPLSLANVLSSWQLGDAVSPQDRMNLAQKFGVSLLPPRVIPRVSALTGGVKMDAFEVHVLESDQKYPIGLIGLYVPARTLDYWIGSIGIYSRAVKDGLDRALIEWSAGYARERGYLNLRAWSTDGASNEDLNALYRDAGFTIQKLEACDPKNPSAQIVIWSRVLHGEGAPERFQGDYAEVLYGMSAADLTEGVRLYDIKRACN